MERKRREQGVLNAVAEWFDLPADVVAGLPRIELVGSREQDVKGIGICRLGNEDVVRHVMVQRIVKAYEEDEKRRSKKEGKR